MIKNYKINGSGLTFKSEDTFKPVETYESEVVFNIFLVHSQNQEIHSDIL